MIQSVQSLSRIWLFATPWTAACQASLSITISQSLLKLISIELVMPSNHLFLCWPLLFLTSVFPSNHSVHFRSTPGAWSNSCPLSQWCHPTNLILCCPPPLLPSFFPSIRVFPNLEPVPCSMSSSNCCFLTSIQVSQEADKVVWYFHLFKNFPQSVVIYTVKGFSIVNEAELDVFFLEFFCFFYDPISVGNLISYSFVFSKSNLNI